MKLSCLKEMFNYERKTLYIVLSMVIISVLTLTVVYAALSTTLNINGTAEVTAASWDIYLDNIELNSSSATTNIPTITDSRTATFSTTLSKPGDYYMFTIDVVNNGTIDAIIDSVTKTPELTDTQKKYLNYIVEYQNGESITTKQLVEKNSFVRLKVKVEFRKDITASDMPSTSETLNLSFKVNYVQSDESNENVTIDNNGKLIKIVSGDYNTVGSEIAIGDEHFYIISNDGENITMLAKYNLYVGGYYDTSTTTWNSYGNEITGIQDQTMLGYTVETIRKGTIEFSSKSYWTPDENSYSSYVYDDNSTLYNHVQNYKIYLESQGAVIEEARLIKYEELSNLGCIKSNQSCGNAPSWVYATSYWTGSAYDNTHLWFVLSTGGFSIDDHSYVYRYGIRPIIVVKA